MSATDAKAAANALKDEANKLFAGKQWEAAVKKYSEAIALVRTIEDGQFKASSNRLPLSYLHA